MVAEVPPRINAEFIQEVLRRSEQDDTIEVIDMHSELATNKGDNYCSDMYRIYLEITRLEAGERITKKKSLILKLAPREGNRKDLIEKANIFPTEMEMMVNTVEKMNKIVGKNHRFNPTAYYVEKECPKFLLLEDLAPLGFRMANRQSGLDFEHSLLVMRNLAKFHASSAVLCQREPSQRDLYRKGMFNHEDPEEVRIFFGSAVKGLADEMEYWPELAPKYAKKMRELSNDLYAKGQKVLERRDEEFNVINHGDCWVNNILFRYDDEGKPVEHIFVDYQMCIYTSPAIDLHYFLSTSLSPKVCDKSKEHLLEEYLSTLTSCLKEFGYQGEIPTMNVLQRHLEEREFYIVVSSVMLLPSILVDKEKAVDIDEIIKEDGTYCDPGFKSQTFRKLMTQRIPYFEERGLLD